MKKIKMMIVALVCLTMQSVNCFAGNELVSATELPTPAIEFLAQHFGEFDITTVEKSKVGMRTQYIVTMNDGTAVTFKKNGRWQKVNSVESGVPSQLVPESVATYVSHNYPGKKIMQITQNMMGYDVELSNHVELSFNQSTSFYGMNF